MTIGFIQQNQEAVIELLLNKESHIEEKFEEILRFNSNNIPLSICMLREWLRTNTNRGKVKYEVLHNSIEVEKHLMSEVISEMFLDDIQDNMCEHIRDILRLKSVSVIDFHESHLNNIHKPIKRLLSSL